MLNEERVREIFQELGALSYGHFLYTSGRHGKVYIQCARLLENPKETEEIVAALASQFKDEKIDLVLGPATGGIILAYEFARQLGTKGIFAERENNKMILRRNFQIPAGARVLIVEDVITTGGSVKEVIEIVEQEGGQVAGVAVIADRTGGKMDFGCKFVSALSEAIESYPAEDCPLCKDSSLELVKPGSRKIDL